MNELSTQLAMFSYSLDTDLEVFAKYLRFKGWTPEVRNYKPYWWSPSLGENEGCDHGMTPFLSALRYQLIEEMAKGGRE